MWRTIRFVLLQIAGTLLALYLILEVWARLFPPKDRNVWPLVQNPAVGTTFQPNARVVLTNGLDFRVEEHANEAGFLDRPLPPIGKPAGSCRIAFIGDSFVEAAQVPIGQKVQVEIQRQLQAAQPSRPVETMAFGFSGTGQLNQLGYLETFARPRKPDVIVLVFVSNDFANNSALLEAIRVGWHPAHAPRTFAREVDGKIELQPLDPDWMRHRLPAAEDTRPALHRWLSRTSRFYRWLYAKLTLQYPAVAHWIGNEPTYGSRIAARIASLQRIAPEQARLLEGWDPERSSVIDSVFDEPAPYPPAFEQAIRFTDFAFETYRQRADADGARLIVLGTHELSDTQEARVKEILARRDIPFVSLKSYISGLGHKPSEAQWRHDGHWNPEGHAWAAQALAKEIETRGFCRRG